MKNQQSGPLKLPAQLEFYYSFGSVVVAIPDAQGRSGCHGPCVAWLNPGEETFGRLHAEAAAATRQDDAEEILKRWHAVAQSLHGAARCAVSRAVVMEEITALEQFIQTRGRPGDGFTEFFAAARAAAAVADDPGNSRVADAIQPEAEIRVIKHGSTVNTISGPYFVVFMLGTRVGASVTCISTPEQCQSTAEEYSRLYGAPIVTPRIESAPPVTPAS